MDCHRCEFIRYDGHRYGHCAHPGHSDVKFVMRKNRPADSKRPYSKLVCNEFRLRRRCSNCARWVRGKYFSDGETPSVKGHCSLGNAYSIDGCPDWESSVKCPKSTHT